MSNLNLPVDRRLIDWPHQNDGMMAAPPESEMLARGAVRFPESLLIPRGEWDNWISQNDANKSAAIDYSARYTHQGDSHECVCHASTQSFEVAYNRQFAGTRHAVYFSPLALYTRITGGRQWGGSNVMDAVEELMNRGALPECDGPEWLGGKGGQAKKFKVTVHQTAGRDEAQWATHGWIRESQFPAGWEQTARHFRVLEAWTIPDEQAHASALLRGYCVVNGRNGHSIPHVQLVKSDGRYLSKYRDSYNRDLFDSERLWGGGYAIAAVTSPDDPQKPAGAEMKE